jgi:hypothetical protein
MRGDERLKEERDMAGRDLKNIGSWFEYWFFACYGYYEV